MRRFDLLIVSLNLPVKSTSWQLTQWLHGITSDRLLSEMMPCNCWCQRQQFRAHQKGRTRFIGAVSPKRDMQKFSDTKRRPLVWQVCSHCVARTFQSSYCTQQNQDAGCMCQHQLSKKLWPAVGRSCGFKQNGAF